MSGEVIQQEHKDGPAPGDTLASCLSHITGLLPNIFYGYEKLCKIVASPDVHNLGFYVSTFFCGPAGLYIWESATGGWFRRLWRGILAWIVLLFGVFLFIRGFGWLLAIPLLLLGRPFRLIIRWTRLARPRPALEIPKDLTFKFGYLDIASLIFIAFIFLVMVANRDDLLSLEPVTNSDPAYHMAAARQIIEHGAVPRWDRWEYAPFGRPHLYPPLLHIMIAFFSGSPDKVLFGFNTIQILLFPLSLLCGWYFARWYFGAAGGFASLIILSMGTSFLMSNAMVLPAAIVTALIPIILMAFLTRRTFAVVVLLGVSFYMHLGMPFMVMAGLLVLSIKYRDYFPFFRKITAFAGLLYLPWILKMLPYMDWLGSSTGAVGKDVGLAGRLVIGVLQLQILNPILLLLALIIWFRDKDERLGPIKCILIGFLPMLLSYGGRYFMHTWPLWAILAGRVFQGWLSRAEEKAAAGEHPSAKSLKRRVIVLLAFTLLPLPVVTLGMPGHMGFGVMPGVTGSNAAVALAFWRSEPDDDFDRLADFIRKTLPPEPISEKPPSMDAPDSKTYEDYLASWEYVQLKSRIVHVGAGPLGGLYFGDRLSMATGCRVDTGGWGPEVRSDLMNREVERAREEDPECLFAFFKGKKSFTPDEVTALKFKHRLEWTRGFGEHYLVGGRGLAPAEIPDANGQHIEQDVVF